MSNPDGTAMKRLIGRWVTRSFARTARLDAPQQLRLGGRSWIPIVAVTAILVSMIVPSRYYFLTELREDMLRTAQNTLGYQTTALAEQADASFKSLDLVLSSVGDYITRKGVNDAASYDRLLSDKDTELFLKEKITGLTFVDAIAVIDEAGRLINFSRGWPAPAIDVSDRDAFQALKNDSKLETYIGKPVESRFDHGWEISLARRLSDRNGNFMGLLLGVVRVPALENFFRSTLPADGTTVSLLRADGILLAGAPRTQELGSYPLIEQISNDGETILTAAHPLPNYPLLVLATRNKDSVLQDWRSMAAQMSAMTAVTVIILLMGAVLIGRWRSQQGQLARADVEKAEMAAERLRMDAERAKALRDAELSAAHETRLAADRTRLRKFNTELAASNARAEAAIAALREAEGELQTKNAELVENIAKVRAAEEQLQIKNAALEENIAKLHDAEEELQSKNATLEENAEELKRSNAELEQFAYVASHDLQEPLRMVSSYCQLLKRRYGDKLGEDAGEFINYAVDGATRMQQLIKDLLAFSRVGRVGGEFEPVDMNAVLENALANLGGAIADNSAKIENTDLPRIHGQRVQLQQMFQNIIGNAIKFRREDTPAIRVAATPAENGFMHFTIQDNGIGIPKEHLERAFVIFQRLHEREKYAGTGIGLAIVKKTVEFHGGKIWIESTVGEGSCFNFTLPVAKEGEAAAAA